VTEQEEPHGGPDPIKDAIPDQAYRKMVLTLMDKQAGREVATAEVFGQCVLYAPTVEDKIRITRFQHEEAEALQLIARLMAELGVDMDAYVRDRQKAGARFTGDRPTSRSRTGSTHALQLHDRPRGDVPAQRVHAGQLRALAEANRVILKEEEGHKNFGEACLEEMTRDEPTRAEIQRRFKKWFVASMRIFGRAKTPGNQYCIDVGLKTRDSGDIAAPISTASGQSGALRAPFPDRSEITAGAAAAGRSERARRGGRSLNGATALARRGPTRRAGTGARAPSLRPSDTSRSGLARARAGSLAKNRS